MRLPLMLGAVLLLAACGADGEPVQPTATANVTLNQNGIGLGTNLRLGKGPFSVNLGARL